MPFLVISWCGATWFLALNKQLLSQHAAFWKDLSMFDCVTLRDMPSAVGFFHSQDAPKTDLPSALLGPPVYCGAVIADVSLMHLLCPADVSQGLGGERGLLARESHV